MNRRSFLTHLGAATLGIGVTVFTSRIFTNLAPITSRDIERTLLEYYKPAHRDLKKLFLKIATYEEALVALVNKGLIHRNQINIGMIDELAKTDPIFDFQGWQYLESELLLYLASYLLVEETLCDGNCLSHSDPFKYKRMTLLENIDFYGGDIRALKVQAEDTDSALQMCADLCLETPGCEYLTLATMKHTNVDKRHTCWLKNNNVQIRKSQNHKSGIKWQP